MRRLQHQRAVVRRDGETQLAGELQPAAKIVVGLRRGGQQPRGDRVRVHGGVLVVVGQQGVAEVGVVRVHVRGQGDGAAVKRDGVGVLVGGEKCVGLLEQVHGFLEVVAGGSQAIEAMQKHAQEGQHAHDLTRTTTERRSE